MRKINYKEYYKKATEHQHKKVLGRISCSSLPYLEKCSFFKNRQSEEKEASLKGTTLHAILEENLDDLLSEQVELIDFEESELKKLNFIVGQIREMSFEGWSIHSQEIFMEDDDLGICGSVDLILCNKEIDSYAILDYKTGVVDIEPSSAQIAGYGALFMELIGACKVWGGVLQFNNEVDAVLMTRTEARNRVLDIIGNKRSNVSGNCRYCANILTCPTVKEVANKFLEGGFDLKEERDLVPVLESKIEAVKAKATEHLKAGLDLEGYRLGSRKNSSVQKMAYRVIIDKVGIDNLLEQDLIKISAGDIIPDEFVTQSVSEFAVKARGKK